MKREHRKVTKEEFELFVNNYENQLDIKEHRVCDPPLRTYNDFVKYKEWPESIVAYVKLYSDFPWMSEDDKYYLVLDIGGES